MKKIHCIIIILSLLAVNAYGQRAIKGFESFSDYREMGEIRFWTFIVSDSVVGTLLSTVKEEISIDGSEGYRIEEKLKLDYNKANIALKMDILNQHYVSNQGYHLGDKMTLNINEQSEKLEVFREGNKVEGFATRNGKKDDVSITFEKSTFSIENNYFDQLELYLAAKDMTIGTVFNDSFYMPQSMSYNYILGEVMEFENSQLYNQVFDSSFVIEFIKPFEQLVYFTPDKRLVKIFIPSQKLKAYLDAVRNPQKALAELEKAAQKKGKFVEKTFAKNYLGSYLGGIFAYLVLGIISILFFIKSGYKSKENYIAFITGCLVYLLLPFTQIPLQKYLESALFLPQVTTGGSPFFWGIFPVLPAGIIQEVVKLLSIILFIRIMDVKKQQFAVVGAALGFGFGFLEAAYLAWNTPIQLLFGITLVERGFTLLFHVTAGAFLGWVSSKKIKQIIPYLVVTIGINTFFRYLPVFAKEKVLTPDILTILLSIVAVIFLFWIVLLFRKQEV